MIKIKEIVSILRESPLYKGLSRVEKKQAVTEFVIMYGNKKKIAKAVKEGKQAVTEFVIMYGGKQ